MILRLGLTWCWGVARLIAERWNSYVGKTIYNIPLSRWDGVNYYEEGSRKLKWVSTEIKEHESKKKAEKKLIQIRDEFINKLETITITKTEDKKVQILFSYFMIKWLVMIKHQVEESTYTGYKRQIEGRTKEYFTKNPVVFDKIKVVQKIGLFQLKNGPLFK